MKDQTKRNAFLAAAATVLLLSALPARSVDLLQRYPTTLTAGDTDPDHARPWEFSAEDIYRVSHFEIKIGDKFKVESGAADVGVGHCKDGAVWAVLIPREEGSLTSTATENPEAIANVWLRFHPAQIDRVFPPDTVSADGNTNLARQIETIVQEKFPSSWHAGMNAMIPERKDLTVFADTRDNSQRFFVVDTKAETAEYIAAFNERSRPSSRQIQISSLATAPPVVVKTVPESGAMNVEPGVTEIRVTFSKEMADGSWSWCDVWEGSTPEGIEAPHYEANHKTCVLKAKLEPGKTYGYWLNTERFTHFQDRQGHSAVPYLLVFHTKDGNENESAQAESEEPPKIVASSPQPGDTDVDPALSEITVTFDRDMAGGFSWTGSGPNYPPTPEGKRAHWLNKRTCALPVKLQEANYYRVGINSKSFQNFRSADGIPAMPSAIYFTTRGASEELRQMATKPQIVSLIPENGAKDVDVKLAELRVTFNVPMGGGFSWTGGGPDFPTIPEGQRPHWSEDQKTCILPVQLESGHAYHLGLNSPYHKNFQSAGGVPLEPVEYSFTTQTK